jgi:Replication initiation factor
MSVANHSQSGTSATVTVSAHIDWISYTVNPISNRKVDNGLVLFEDFKKPYRQVRATNGYSNARQYVSGAIVQWHPAHPSMGIHCIYTAQALSFASKNFGLSQDAILEELSQYGRISRIDLCLDIGGMDIDIRKLYKDALSGKIKSRAKTFGYVESAEKGNEKGAATAYIGSMHKRKKLLRVYDKGKQLNLDDFKIRFELEQHGKIADDSAAILRKDPERIAENIAGLIKGYADFTDTVAGFAFDGTQAIKAKHPEYKKSDTAKWLIEVVAKTLAREVSSDYNVLDDFMSAFKYHLTSLAAEMEDNHDNFR